MTIDIELQDENGDVIDSISDDRILTFKLIPPLTDKKSVLLRFVDPYGDTVFNNLQASDLKAEIENKLGAVTDNELQEYWRKVVRLVDKLASESHLYLKFIGD